MKCASAVARIIDPNVVFALTCYWKSVWKFALHIAAKNVPCDGTPGNNNSFLINMVGGCYSSLAELNYNIAKKLFDMFSVELGLNYVCVN